MDFTTFIESQRLRVTAAERRRENEEMLARYGRLFDPANIPNLTAEEFKPFLSHKNNKHWGHIQRQSGLLTRDMDRLRAALSILVDEEKPLRERLEKLFPKGQTGFVKGLGRAIATPILTVVYPEKYGVFNSRSERALKRLGLLPDFERGASFADRYIAVNDVLKRLAREHNLSLLELDHALGWFGPDKDTEDHNGDGLVQIEDETIESLQTKFAQLFEEFVETYPATPGGQGHIEMYERGREQGRRNFEEIIAAARRGEDVTEQVLLKLLPYQDSDSNRERGAWIHVGPVFATDVRKKFEGSRWTKPEDWPHVAQAILRFVYRCNNDPLELQASCEEFAGSPYSTGFQMGTLTPILNALRPDDFMLINKKPRQTINYFAGTSYSPKLTEYPAINAAGRELIQRLSGVMHRFDVPEIRDTDLFDMFSHWLVAEKKFFDPTATRRPESAEPVSPPVKAVRPPYTLAQCAAKTGFEESMLTRWIRAIERKGQAIVYGPPGTGKTYLAEHLARHLIGRGDGFYEIVQFHPAYAYEDFIQGIRPKAKSDGQLDYPVVPGRFLEFCEKAEGCQGCCVLIIDEINRANLARIFGELMYLLEYRDRQVPLAGGGLLRIPANVRIIGTMNTADRSIALVDHALRRRFAFLALYPNYDVLQRYHRGTGFNVEPLIGVLHKLNRQIGDRHYEVGITFFLRKDLTEQVEDIWRMEIEPYLEEYFFDQPDKVDKFRWEKVGSEILS